MCDYLFFFLFFFKCGPHRLNGEQTEEDEGSHHSLAQMEMGILYVADVLLPSRLD